MKNEIVPLNSQVMTGMSIEELEDRLEMQMLGVPLENALSQDCLVIIIIDGSVVIIIDDPCLSAI